MQADDIHQVITILEEIVESQLDIGSPLGYFPALYHTVTVAVRDGIDQGFFADGPRMAQLDTVFANRYIVAYDQYIKGQPCSTSWDLAFRAGSKPNLIVLQHLFLGMSAHINLDLGIAAATVAPGEAIHGLESDFFKINVILGSLVDGVQKDLGRIWPLFRVIDWLGGHMDESLARFSMDIARDGAWRVATELAAIRDSGEQHAYVNQLDNRVASFGRTVEQPGWLLSMLLKLIRVTEKGDVRSKIRHLQTA